MTTKQFFKLACEHASRGGRIKATWPDGTKRNIWSGQGNVSGLYGESLYEQSAGRWEKSGDRFKVKLEGVLNESGVCVELQDGWSPDRLRMKYHTIRTFTTP